MSSGSMGELHAQARLVAQDTGAEVPRGLAEGQTLRGTVVESLGDGRYAVQVPGQTLTVDSPVPMEPGQELSLQVLQTQGRVVLGLLAGHAGAVEGGGADASAATAAASLPAGDQASIPAPFALLLPVSDLAEQIPLLPNGGGVSAGLTTDGDQVALHFPDGAVAQATALPLSVLESGQVWPSSGDGVMPPVLVNAAEALLQIDRVMLAAETGAGQPLRLDVAATDLPALLPPGAATSAETLLQATVLDGAGTSDGTLRVRIGHVTVDLSLPAGMSLQPGETVTLRFDADALALGTLRFAGQGMPLADGAVETALRDAGLSPTPLSREAAQALQQQALPVTRENVQSLLALAAGTEGPERTALVEAGARLLAHDIPLAPPLAAGLAARLNGGADAAQLLGQTAAGLRDAMASLPAESPAATELAAAVETLRQVAVALDTAETPARLADFFSTFGRAPLAEAQGRIETAMAQLLGRQPALGNLDAALQTLGPALGAEGEAVATQADARPGGQPAMPGTHAPVSDLGSGALAQLSAEDRQAVEALARQVLDAPDPSQAAQRVRQAVDEGRPETMRALAERLEALERDALARDPALSRLADGAETLRDLGRRFLAYKAENLAGLRQEPALFVAEVPFRLNEEEGAGRVQVMYRRGGRQRGAGKRWSARVVLDLQTTHMGPVVGDLRFFRRNVQLSLYVAHQEIADWLEDRVGELTAAMREKGFQCLPAFHLIPEAKDEPSDMPSIDAVPRPLGDGAGHVDLQA